MTVARRTRTPLIYISGDANRWANCLQHKVVEEADSAAALAVLGEVSRAKLVRNLTKTRTGRLRTTGR